MNSQRTHASCKSKLNTDVLNAMNIYCKWYVVSKGNFGGYLQNEIDEKVNINSRYTCNTNVYIDF